MDAGELARELGRIASELGPALAPAGLRESLQPVVDTAALAFEAGGCSVAVLVEDGESLEFAATSHGDKHRLLGTRFPTGRGIAGFAVASGQALAVQDVASDQRFARDIAEASGYVPSSILAFPIEHADGPLGVLSVLDRTDSPRDMQLAAGFAGQAAVAIAAVRAFDAPGRALLHAAAASARGGGVAAVLRDAADATPPGSADLAELAAAFAELAELGPRERAAATRLVTHFLAYARRP